MRKLHALFVIGLMIWLPLYSSVANSALVDKVFTWIAPTTYTDGSLLLPGDIDSYKLYCGHTPDLLLAYAPIIDPAATAYTGTGFDDTLPWYCAMTTVAYTGESAYSNIVQFGAIASSLPSAPGSLTVSDPVPPPPPIVGTLLLNSGGQEITAAIDASVWSADNYYSGGNASVNTAVITGTTYPELFNTIRWMNGNISYQIPVTAGSKTVNLMFAETVALAAGERVFSISIEGVIVDPSLDVFAQAGGANIAVQKTYIVDVADTMLDIVLIRGIGTTFINALTVE